MKKTISILLILLFSCLVNGCGRENIKGKDINTTSETVNMSNGEYEVVAYEQSKMVEKEDRIDVTEQSKAANRTDELIRNPYFYDKEEMFLQAEAKYYVGREVVEKDVYIQMDMLQAYEEGTVYKFTVDIGGDIDERDYYRDLGWLDYYFYVTKDRIYSVTFADNLPDIEFNLNDNADILTEIYDTDEKLVEWGIIVCQEDEMIEEQESVYRSIMKTESQVTYYAYSIKANGDIGWSMYYAWQKGKGLVSCGFRHGPGEGYDLILNEIEELIVVE